MFLATCFRQGRPVTHYAGSACFRRAVSTSNGNESRLTRTVIGRAKHYIEFWAPSAIPVYFRRTVMKRGVPQKVRLETGEALLDLLFRKRFFDEAFQVLFGMRRLRTRLSPQIRAKALTVNLVHGGVRGRTYFHNLERLFRYPEFSGGDADRYFLDILHLLVYPGCLMERVEKAVKVYMGVRGKNYWLNSSVVAIMIARYLGKGKEEDAKRWLDYHSRRAPSSRSRADPAFCLPYTAYAHGQLSATPDKDPQEMYDPLLERMSLDEVQPDASFINALISAELRHDHFLRVFVLYEGLRSHASQGSYPDETTYARLFTTARAASRAHRTAETSRVVRAIFPKARRQLFREMSEMQLRLKHGHLSPVSPIITKLSLNSALRMFTYCDDYAGAIVTLKVFERLHIPLEERALDSVVDSIVSRCRKELASVSDEAKSEPSWADIFLDLRGVPRERLRRANDWDMRRRVISIGRRTLAVAKAREREAVGVGVGVESSKESDGDPDSSESSEIHEDGPVRRQKKKRMREIRFQLIDVLLSRALETSMFIEGHDEPDRAAREALRNAFGGMIPNKDEAKEGARTHTNVEHTHAAQDSEPEPESDESSLRQKYYLQQHN